MEERKLRWGILGTARIATGAVMPAIASSRHGVLEAVASRDAEKSRAAARPYESVKAYGSYEELLEDPGVEAVYIPLPNHMHLEWVTRAAAAGKHVLCEKPAALTASEAEAMAEACAAAGVHLAEAFMYRHHPRYSKLKELLAAGAIGELRSIRGTFTYNDAEDTGNIRFRADWGGGSLYDIGCYPLTAARMLYGAEPEAVTVQAMFSPEHGGVDMMASGLLEFTDGRSLIFDCGMWAYNRQVLELTGTEGRLEIPMPFNAGEKDAGFLLHSGGQTLDIPAPGANAYAAQADDFAEAVWGLKPPLYNSRDAVENMRLLEACLASAKQRSRMVLNG